MFLRVCVAGRTEYGWWSRPAATRTPHQLPSASRVNRRREGARTMQGDSVSVSVYVTARRLAAAALAAGALVGAVALPASATDHARPHRPAVEISDAQYDSPGFDDRSNRSLNKEWV